MAKVRVRLMVEGRVQGVYYRSYAEEEARRLGVTGWIRNRRDGRVEMLLEAEERDVKAMIDWSRQGSPLSRVDNVEVAWEPYAGDLSDFRVTYTRGGDE